MSLSVQGKVAIVTGAGHGIGRAIAHHLLEKGAKVMLADKDEDALEREVADFESGQEGEDNPARAFAGDLSKKLCMANLLSATIDAFDRVDILVNAHRFVRPSDPLNTDMDTLDEMLQQNMMAGLRLSQIVAKRMIKQAEERDDEAVQNGAIINISTLASTRPVPELLGYSIACAALDQATRGLALALAQHRIRVNGVSFSSVMSHELKHAIREDEDVHDRVVAGTPMGRIADAAELAETVQFLASEGSRFMTGQIVTVDGGRSLTDPVVQGVL